MKTFFIILLFTFSAFSQQIENAEKFACSKVDKSKVIDYFSNLKSQNNYIFECLRSQNKTDSNTKPFIKISHFNSPIISLVRPFYPETAKKYGMCGIIKVEIIFDETGNVIYSKAISGNMIFYEGAEKAACASRFSPRSYCDKLVKQKATVLYNFR